MYLHGSIVLLLLRQVDLSVNPSFLQWKNRSEIVRTVQYYWEHLLPRLNWKKSILRGHLQWQCRKKNRYFSGRRFFHSILWHAFFPQRELLARSPDHTWSEEAHFALLSQMLFCQSEKKEAKKTEINVAATFVRVLTTVRGHFSRFISCNWAQRSQLHQIQNLTILTNLTNLTI